MKTGEVTIEKRKYIEAEIDWDKVTALEDIKTLMKHCNMTVSGYEGFISKELEKYMKNIKIHET